MKASSATTPKRCPVGLTSVMSREVDITGAGARASTSSFLTGAKPLQHQGMSGMAALRAAVGRFQCQHKRIDKSYLSCDGKKHWRLRVVNCKKGIRLDRFRSGQTPCLLRHNKCLRHGSTIRYTLRGHSCCKCLISVAGKESLTACKLR